MKTVCEMLVRLIPPHYSSEGKSRLTIGIGCSGGQHRSVAITERLAKNFGRPESTARPDIGK